jgi:hypothetical protein
MKTLTPILNKKIKKESMTFGKYKITLKCVKEVKGHDDSLPFIAKMYVNNKPFCEAYNDGWGGSAMLTITNNDLFEMVNDEVIKYSIIYGKREICKYTLSDIADELACIIIDNKKLWNIIKNNEVNNFIFYNGISSKMIHYTTTHENSYVNIDRLFKSKIMYLKLSEMIKEMCSKNNYKCINKNVPMDFIEKFDLKKYFNLNIY